jgi:ribonuclease PH
MTIEVPMKRSEDRALDQLRTVSIERDVNAFAEGSALIKVGMTHVLCTATVDNFVPKWMYGKGSGWVTAEYSMLPRSTSERTDREAVRGKQGGRTVEIQRLIGRSLRAVVDMRALGERQIIIDCDVLQADGGTRCASITGAFVAMAVAIDGLVKQKKIRTNPLRSGLAAVSVGVVKGVPVLDLDYQEDSNADVDANVIMTNTGRFVELQSTAEHDPFSRETLQHMIALSQKGISELTEIQRSVLGAAYPV